MSSFYDLLRNLPDEQAPGPEPDQQMEPGAEPAPEQQSAPSSREFWKELSDVVPQGWRPEKEFASSEEALQFYHGKFNGLWQHLNSDEFARELEQNYGDALAAREEEIETFKEVLAGFKTDPMTFMATYIPEYAEQLGIGKIYDEHEMDEYIEEQLTEQFGENWRDVYNPADLIKPSSMSARIQRYSQQLSDQILQQNSMVEQRRQQYLATIQQRQQPQQVAPQVNIDEQVDALADAFYDEGLADQMSEDEFLELVSEAMNRPMKLTDVYRSMRFEQIIEQEREKAREEGRKAMMEEMRKGGKIASQQYVPPSTKQSNYHEENPPTILGLRVR
jgi:hypothetical protein